MKELIKQILLGQFLAILIWVFLFCIVLLFKDLIVCVLLSFIGATLVVHNFGFMMGYLPNFLALLDQISFVKDFQVVKLKANHV